MQCPSAVLVICLMRNEPIWNVHNNQIPMLEIRICQVDVLLICYCDLFELNVYFAQGGWVTLLFNVFTEYPLIIAHVSYLLVRHDQVVHPLDSLLSLALPSPLWELMFLGPGKCAILY